MEHLDLWIVLGAVLLTIGLMCGLAIPQILETGSWGLSFPARGQSPAGPVSSGELAKFDAFYLGKESEPVLYLTFDAGYENGYTGQILDTLKAHNAPAAFFLVGNYLQRNPDLVRRMAEEGHTVGNHTMHHPDMSKYTDLAEFTQELTALEDCYREITGQEMAKFYRPPQGLYSQKNLEMAQSLGYTTVFWSLAYADWDNANQPDPEQALEKLLSRTHNGAIVLLHSTSQTNAEILDTLLTRWEELGYRFGSLEELAGEL